VGTSKDLACSPVCRLNKSNGSPVHRPMRRSAALAGAAVLLVARAGQGQEILLTGPLPPPPPEYWVGSVPARLEWSYWMSGGALVSTPHERAGPAAFAGAGAELTVEALRYHGFPSGCYGKYRGEAEVRTGPWVSVATRRFGGLVEGGLKVHAGGVFHASFGTWDVRLGAGYAGHEAEAKPHLSATFAYGVRGVLKRYPRDRSGQWQRAEPEPPGIIEAQVARLFVTARRGLRSGDIEEVVLGVELSPTFLLPPYSWWRFGGGPPW
jgi:hypothetical protein